MDRFTFEILCRGRLVNTANIPSLGVLIEKACHFCVMIKCHSSSIATFPNLDECLRGILYNTPIMRPSTTVPETTVHSINDFLATYVAQKRADAAVISPFYADLWAEMERLLMAGGKRLRPRLVMLSYDALGGSEDEAVMPVAAATELLHLAMLIHDDIIDRDTVRYGVKNIAGSYADRYRSLLDDEPEREHFALSAGLLAGDALLSESYRLMATAPFSPQTLLAVQALLSQGVFEVIGGELLDTEQSFRPTGAIDSVTIAEYKTSSYSFVLPLLIGATLAQATPDQVASVREFGQHIGVAFQLRDDIIGVFGDAQVTGKSTIGDLREGKQTYLVEQFRAVASTEQRTQFDALFGRATLDEAQAAVLRTLLVQSGAQARTEQAIAEYEQRARQSLATLALSEQSAEAFDKFIDAVTKRVK